MSADVQVLPAGRADSELSACLERETAQTFKILCILVAVLPRTAIRNAVVCVVLPRPMSSPRMHPVSLLQVEIVDMIQLGQG